MRSKGADRPPTLYFDAHPVLISGKLASNLSYHLALRSASACVGLAFLLPSCLYNEDTCSFPCLLFDGKIQYVLFST
jgi:hypothetical protein